jgi:hypothetical protein
MVKNLIALLAIVRVELLELIGAGLVVAGVYRQWGTGAAFIASGVALLAKSMELDLGRGDRS